MIQHWLQVVHMGNWDGAIVGFLLIIIVSFLPVFPIPALAGVLGAVYPLWLALLVSWSAATIAALSKFYVLRYILRKHALNYLERYPKLKPALRFIEQNGFSAVLLARVIPIVPSAVINIAASVTPISTRAFVFATMLGKLPIMLAFTIAGNQWRTNSRLSLAIIVFYVLIILILWRHLHRKLQRDAQ